MKDNQANLKILHHNLINEKRKRNKMKKINKQIILHNKAYLYPVILHIQVLNQQNKKNKKMKCKKKIQILVNANQNKLINKIYSKLNLII